MLVELVSVRTEDGCLLDAAYWAAVGEAPARMDACVLVHGAGGNEFSPTQRALAEGLAQAGVDVLTLSTRGHDIVSRTMHPSGPRLGGVACEDLDEAPLDLRAGMRWLAARGHARVGLAGHSLGAVKSILTEAVGAGATSVLALSPPRFCFETQAHVPAGRQFLQSMEEARALVEGGRPDALIRTEAPIASYFSAAMYLKKYGPEDRYDIVRLLPSVHCPVLLLYGALETGLLAAVGGTASTLPTLVPADANMTRVIVDGADHVYTNRVPQVLAAIHGWLTAAHTPVSVVTTA